MAEDAVLTEGVATQRQHWFLCPSQTDRTAYDRLQRLLLDLEVHRLHVPQLLEIHS